MARKLARRLGQAWLDGGDAVTIIEGETSWTARQLGDHADRLQAHLEAHGVAPTEPVCVLVSNRAVDFAAFLAVWRLGGVVVPIHRTSPKAAQDQIFAAAGCRLLLDGLDSPAVHSTGAPQLPDPLLEDAAVVVFTSGSTGLPKGVVLSHTALATKLDNNCRVLDFHAGERTLLALQITFSFGLWVSLLTLTTGGLLVIHQKFDPAAVLRDIRRHAITRTGLVPTMLRAILASGLTPDTPSLRHIYTGGELLSGPLGQTVAEAFASTTLFNIFGLTETGTCDLFLHGRDLAEHPGAVGRPGPGVSIRIADEAGNPVPAGSVGELQIQTETIMSGYLGQPDLTAASFADGFFRTGDLARASRDGIVEVVGRAKELISRGGNKVYPQEVELALQSHPAVALALATGLPDPLLGERIHAAILLKPGKQADADSLRAWTAERLDKFKRPDAIHFVEELPTGRTGKADRKRLGELLAANGAASEGHAQPHPSHPPQEQRHET